MSTYYIVNVTMPANDAPTSDVAFSGHPIALNILSNVGFFFLAVFINTLTPFIVFGVWALLLKMCNKQIDCWHKEKVVIVISGLVLGLVVVQLGVIGCVMDEYRYDYMTALSVSTEVIWFCIVIVCCGYATTRCVVWAVCSMLEKSRKVNDTAKDAEEGESMIWPSEMTPRSSASTVVPLSSCV